MSTCNAELVRGILITTAGVAGVGTGVDITSLFTAGAVELFNEITVYNDADDIIRVQWLNTVTGQSEDFIVPNGGKAYTRVLNAGDIATTSLKVYSMSDTVAADGNITINLAKH